MTKSVIADTLRRASSAWSKASATVVAPEVHPLYSRAFRIKGGSLSCGAAWSNAGGDRLGQIGASHCCAGIAAWQMRQRQQTCRVKDSLRHTNKSRLFPLEMRYLWFSEDNYWVPQWHVFQGHTVLFNAPRLSVNSHLTAAAPPACWSTHFGAALKTKKMKHTKK